MKTSKSVFFWKTNR